MSIHSPPKYRYALFTLWDRKAFALIENIGKTGKYPRILGRKDDIDQFLTILIRTQKSTHDWRNFLADILKEVKRNGVINTRSLNKKYPPSSISKAKPAWETYEEDKIVSDFIDELETRRIHFQGKNQEISEFVCRFILGQLGDWECTIMMIWEMLGDKKELTMKYLNREMKNFDYLKLFERS